MFVILLFGKFVALFLMVVHHIEFYYVLVTAVCLDVTAIATGSASISSECVAFNLLVLLFFFYYFIYFFTAFPCALYHPSGYSSLTETQPLTLLFASAST